jgi:hypothetical protein
LHFLCGTQFENKMQPPIELTGHTSRKGQNPAPQSSPQSRRILMMHLVLSFLDGDANNIFGSFGLWAFLSVGAVALFGIFLPITTWLDSRRKDRESFYKAETLRRVTEGSPDGAKASVEYLREINRLDQIKTIEGLKIGGLIMTAIGIGVCVLLWFLTGLPVAAAGVIPLLIGVAMLAYVFFLAGPVDPARKG